MGEGSSRSSIGSWPRNEDGSIRTAGTAWKESVTRVGRTDTTFFIPADLAESVPNGDAFRDQVLRALADRWTVAYGKVAGLLPLDEIVPASGSPIVYLRGEIDVSSAGPIMIQLDSADGAVFRIDELPVPPGSSALSMPLASGRHTITLRIDTTVRRSREIRVEVVKPAGSTAEFTVIGGR